MLITYHYRYKYNYTYKCDHTYNYTSRMTRAYKFHPMHVGNAWFRGPTLAAGTNRLGAMANKQCKKNA